MNCLDAETLAAWFDGGLTGAALEDVRSHVAVCGRCQALVGAMGRTRAAVPPSEPERNPRWWLAWAVPAAAAATALAIWVAVPRPTNRALTPSPAAVLEKKQAQTPTAPAPAAPADAERAAPPPSAAAPTLQDRARSAEAAASASSPAENDAVQQKPDTANETLSLQSAAAAPSAAERREQAQPRAAVAGQLAARDAFVASPCGSPWPPPPADIASQITAGSAPSADVCWVVGRAGTVLRSTDHQTWVRVTIPQSADLSAVTATDARTATVTASDGRTFSTADGGMTWIQLNP